MLMEILTWVVGIGRSDVAHANSYLSRFFACPREGHLARAFRVFGFLKKRPNRRYVVDSMDPILREGEEALGKDFTQELGAIYPDAYKELDPNLPTSLVEEISITVLVDSDHGNDQVTRRSITGLIAFLDRTPAFYLSKGQGAIKTSTYSAEFCAMKTGVEETIAIRYMMQCLGVNVETASLICGDNMEVIQNSTIKLGLLKKKHVAISYHKTREAFASGTVNPIKTDGTINYANVLMKYQYLKTFQLITGSYFYG